MTLGDDRGPGRHGRHRVLFVSYNSLIEPLGPTQILPYVCGLSRAFDMSVLSFEKPVRSAGEDARDRSATAALLERHGVAWHRLTYHKTPSLPATAYDAIAGVRRIRREHRRRPFDLIHARGYVPAAIALAVKKLIGVPFVFDIRGLQAEEYADAGHWDPRGLPFRVTKAMEQAALRAADGIVTLTHAIRPVLLQFPGLDTRPTLPPWSVIPSCVDLEHFRFDASKRRRVREALGVGDRPVLVYSGSVGTWYMLDEMLAFYQVARERWPGLFLLCLVNRSPETVAGAARSRGIGGGDFAVTWARHAEMPAYLSAADAGIAFIRPCLSKRSSSPTKYAEYLATGLPFVANSGVGDVDALLAEPGAGALVTPHTQEGYAAAADRLRMAASTDRSVRRAIAEREFSVATRACPAYQELYTRILTRQRKWRGLFLTPYPIHSAPSQRLKFEQYYQAFEDHGIEVHVSPFVTRALWRVLYKRGFLGRKLLLGLWGHLRRLRDFFRAPRFDFVYVHLWALPFGPPWFEELLARRRVRVIYDIDDLIYLPRASAANQFVKALRRRDRIVRIMRAAAHVIVCTQHLRALAVTCNKHVTLISSTIDTDLYLPRQHSGSRHSVTIGWSGSHSTAPYVYALGPALRVLATRFEIRLLVIGDPNVTIDGVNVDARAWSLVRETADLAEMDIGVYPLPDEEWVLGKSGLKALQYMGMGVPTVASRIGSACEFIDDGENGFLAGTTEEWVDKLAQLIVDPDLRARMGRRGRTTVEERFSLRVTAPVYLGVIASVLGADADVGAAVSSGAAWSKS
jgi:glycosyltransferase involved in cell wall biosynthesis